MIKCDGSNTQIFFSKIFHKRLRPKIHEFRYNNLYVSVPIRSYSRTENKGNVFFGFNLKFFKHALEWDYFIGVITFYMLTYLMWKKI